MNKLQIAEQFRKALQMFADTLDDERAMTIATVYDRWEAGVAYGKPKLLTYGTNSVGDPQLYRVEQAHVSQADWTPDITPALYTAIGLDERGHPIWSQPTGAHDAYNEGDIVNSNGMLYRSKINGNVYPPEQHPDKWEIVTDEAK